MSVLHLHSKTTQIKANDNEAAAALDIKWKQTFNPYPTQIFKAILPHKLKFHSASIKLKIQTEEY